MAGRIALGLSYAGLGYNGWQSQADGNTVQDRLETALAKFAANGGKRITTLCAGRTDSGVHGVMQVAHFDAPVARSESSWVRGTNRYLPDDIAVQWARRVPTAFHARGSATARRYAYVLLQSPVRPSVEVGRVGWVFRPLNGDAMRAAAITLVGEHDFSSFRAAGCQALSPVKTLAPIRITRRNPHNSVAHQGDPCYWRFEFEASAFLHHMIRNIMGCLIAIGQGSQPPEWMAEVLAARSRKVAAPTFSPDGLYFLGPVYPEVWELPTRSVAYDWLP